MEDRDLDLRGKLTAGKMSPNEARKRQAFRDGELSGRWDSYENNQFFGYMLDHRSRMWNQRTLPMIFAQQENERNMRPGQQCTNMELVQQSFAYIDKMLEDFYVAHFTSVTEVAAIKRGYSSESPAFEDRPCTLDPDEQQTFHMTHASLNSDGSIGLGGYLTTIQEERCKEGRHAPNCNIEEKLSDVCSCGLAEYEEQHE